MNFGEMYKTGDWKGEKHVPAIDIKVEGKEVTAELCVGKEIPHPNALEHHIEYIEAYFLPDGENFPVMVGRMEFRAHGEYNTATKFVMTVKFTTEKPGTLYAKSYCNIHGLWSNFARVEVS